MWVSRTPTLSLLSLQMPQRRYIYGSGVAQYCFLYAFWNCSVFQCHIQYIEWHMDGSNISLISNSISLVHSSYIAFTGWHIWYVTVIHNVFNILTHENMLIIPILNELLHELQDMFESMNNLWISATPFTTHNGGQYACNSVWTIRWKTDWHELYGVTYWSQP